MLERCPDCNALIVLVGLRHRCIPKPKKDPTNGTTKRSKRPCSTKCSGGHSIATGDAGLSRPAGGSGRPSKPPRRSDVAMIYEAEKKRRRLARLERA
jgi:hypothetical protein